MKDGWGSNQKLSAGLSLLFQTVFVSFNATAVLALYAEAGFPVLQATFVTYNVIWIVTTLIYLYQIPDQSILGKTKQEFWFLLARSLLFFGGLNSYLLSLIFLPIGFATTLKFAHPLLATLGTWVWYWRTPQCRDVLNVFCGFAGITLMFNGLLIDGDRFDPEWELGVFLALFSSLCIGVEQMYKNSLRTKPHWIQVEYMTSFLFVMGIVPLSWLFQYLYVVLMGSMKLSYSNIVVGDPIFWHWLLFILIGFFSVPVTYGAERANQVLNARFVHTASHMQIPILYLVDVLWFENGLPRLYEVVGATIFFIVLIVKSFREPMIIPKYSSDFYREGELKFLLGLRITEGSTFDVDFQLSPERKAPLPGYYGSLSESV